MSKIPQLYESQMRIWARENEHFFGISPLADWSDPDVVSNHLADCAERFWNNGTNAFKEMLYDGKCNDLDKLLPGTWELVYDQRSSATCLYGMFEWKDHNRDGEEVLHSRRCPVAYLPSPDNICWWINGARYVLRVTARNNWGLVYKRNGVVYYQKTWTWDEKNGFTVHLDGHDPLKDLTEQNREWLSRWAGVAQDELDEQSMIAAMNALPEWKRGSIYYFTFHWVDAMFQLISGGKRFANPIRKPAVPIDALKIIMQSRLRTGDLQDINGTCNLVMARGNEIFALENTRNIIYRNEWHMNFQFVDSERFFDSFKTSTNKSAGKSRLLLDTVEVHNGRLWAPYGGVMYDMWEWAMHPEWEINSTLSAVSLSHFAVNNAPKRIMMTAKLRGQAVPTVGENDPLTHETSARVVFGDWKGFNYGDSIVISRSLARRLRSHVTKDVSIGNQRMLNELKRKYQPGDQISIQDLSLAAGTTSVNNMRNIYLLNWTPNGMLVDVDLPMSVGDKLTNLHGSKGIVSLILEDDEMPYLAESACGFPAGPFDIIISGMSVYRRKSFGQLFEAWASATGHEDLADALQAIQAHSDEMIEFSRKSVVWFHGESSVKPIGLNVILRLNHDACGKQSHSIVKSNTRRMLKMGEMELLCLAARGLTGILNEIDVRSVSKHGNSLQLIADVQRTGMLPQVPANNLAFTNILRACGFDLSFDEDGNIEQWDEKPYMQDDETINLSEDGEV